MASSTKKQSSGSQSHLLQDLVGLIFLFLAVFTVLSLVSYSSQDPSFFTSARTHSKNLAGLVGSHWASILWQTMGAAAFMQAFIFLLAGVALFRRISKQAWFFACTNYLLLLVSTAACFGLVQRSLTVGGTHFAMGGLLGDLLSGFFRSYLNTAGAGLLCGCLFVFAISLSTKISVRDLALHAWLLVSRVAVRILGALFYVGLQIWGAASAAYGEMRPAVGENVKGGWGQLMELYSERQHKRAEAKAAALAARAAEPEILEQEEGFARDPEAHKPTITAPTNVYPIRRDSAPRPQGAEAAPSFEDAEAPDLDEPSIITDSAGDAQTFFDTPGEMAKAEGEKSTMSPLMNFVKKAVSGNEKAIKAALGKKIKYQLPPLSFLNTPVHESRGIDKDELFKNSKMLADKLADFNVKGQVTAVKPGPVVTMYEFKPAAGVKLSSISNLSDDLALALSAKSIRIVAPIPGRDVVGIEVPNKDRESVLLKEIVGAETFDSKNHSIPVAVGKDILGAPVVADLKKMPHLLVAGTTGSGKSVFVNTLLCSLLYKFTPNDLNLILVDPKQLELAPYNDIPHLLLPVVTEPKKAALALNWAVQEMERRYKLIAKSVTRDQEGYNKKLEEIGVEKMDALLNKGKGELDERFAAERMPKLVVVIDELADLMMTAKADVESNICRLAQKARAAGVHLVLATQRPSTDVVTGLIKANLPSRICFKVSSKIDSRVMFDAMGAEKLIGNGDMLFMPPGESTLVRLHGAYISVEEVDQITGFWRAQGKPNYREDILIDPEADGDGDDVLSAEDTSDPLYAQAKEIATSTGQISASYLQRRLRIGYNKAARFVEMMDAQGMLAPTDGVNKAKPRQVLGQRT